MTILHHYLHCWKFRVSSVCHYYKWPFDEYLPTHILVCRDLVFIFSSHTSESIILMPYRGNSSGGSRHILGYCPLESWWQATLLLELYLTLPKPGTRVSKTLCQAHGWESDFHDCFTCHCFVWESYLLTSLFVSWLSHERSLFCGLRFKNYLFSSWYTEKRDGS